MRRGVFDLDGAFIFAVKAGLDLDVHGLHVGGLQTADAGQHQTTVGLDAVHHGAQSIHVRHQHNGLALAAQMGADAALIGVFGLVTQTGQLGIHVLLHFGSVAAGAVNGHNGLQLFQHIFLILLFHGKPPKLFMIISEYHIHKRFARKNLADTG